jgi:hypothetical protein
MMRIQRARFTILKKAARSDFSIRRGSYFVSHYFSKNLVCYNTKLCHCYKPIPKYLQKYILVYKSRIQIRKTGYSPLYSVALHGKIFFNDNFIKQLFNRFQVVAMLVEGLYIRWQIFVVVSNVQ